MSGEAILNHPKGAGVFPKVDLIEPDGHGYLFAAAVVDRRLPFAYFRESADKQHLLLKLKQRVDALRALPGVAPRRSIRRCSFRRAAAISSSNVPRLISLATTSPRWWRRKVPPPQRP
jgi:hypothetical protein